MTAIATREALSRLSRPLRLRAAAGWIALGLGAAALLLGAMAWAVRLHWLSAPYWVLVAWAVALGALAGAAWPAWRTVSRLSTGAVAGRLEELGAWRRGSLTALLDTSARGTSDALLEPPVARGRVLASTFGNRLQRTIYHYWYHTGENMGIRQALGHTGLPDFVGDIDTEAPYRPE